MKINKIYNGDTLDVLKTFPDESIDSVVTSPPYWALRDYNVDGQLGLEPTFQEYINKLCDIFDEVKRVLKKEGTCWVNIGDSYFGSGKGVGGNIENSKEVWHFNKKEKRICKNCGKEFIGWKFQNFCGSACSGVDNTPRKKKGKLEDKCLIKIPSRFAIEMINRGWILRNDIIWHKPNAMPSSVKDRFTVDYEHIFFFVKQKKYYFEQILEPYSKNSRIEEYTGMALKDYESNLAQNPSDTKRRIIESMKRKNGRNKRTVWSITAKPFKDAHFAVFPPEIPETCLTAGCPKDGIVLDPFMGSGTTAVVAKKLGRDWVGIELNKEYIEMAYKRINAVIKTKKLFAEAE